MISSNGHVQARIALLVLAERVQVRRKQVLQNIYVAFECIQVQQTRSCGSHGHLVQTLTLLCIVLADKLENAHVPPIHSVLDRTHHLFGLAHAFKAKAGSVLAQQFQAT